MTRDPKDELVDHIPAMRAFAISLTRNASLADDMVQDSLVKAWTNFDKFQVGTNMRAWLFTIVRNTYYSHHRKRSREVEDIDGDLSASLAQKPDHDGRLQMREFNAAFDQLNEDQREAIVLVGAGGFSYEEAAKISGVAMGTIKSRVNRARARLIELLDVDEDGELEATDSIVTAVVTANQSAA